MDGSVRFQAETIDLQVLASPSPAAGGGVVSDQVVGTTRILGRRSGVRGRFGCGLRCDSTSTATSDRAAGRPRCSRRSKMVIRRSDFAADPTSPGISRHSNKLGFQAAGHWVTDYCSGSCIFPPQFLTRDAKGVLHSRVQQAADVVEFIGKFFQQVDAEGNLGVVLGRPQAFGVGERQDGACRGRIEKHVQLGRRGHIAIAAGSPAADLHEGPPCWPPWHCVYQDAGNVRSAAPRANQRDLIRLYRPQLGR